MKGGTKFDRFDQLSAYYQRLFSPGNFSVDWQLIGSKAEDIGKDNSQFPLVRRILYQENHMLSQVELSGAGTWAARFSALPVSADAGESEFGSVRRGSNPRSKRFQIAL